MLLLMNMLHFQIFIELICVKFEDQAYNEKLLPWYGSSVSLQCSSAERFISILRYSQEDVEPLCNDTTGKKVAYRDMLEGDIGCLVISHLSIHSSINTVKASTMHLLHIPVPHHRLKVHDQVDLEHYLQKAKQNFILFFFLCTFILGNLSQQHISQKVSR